MKPPAPRPAERRLRRFNGAWRDPYPNPLVAAMARLWDFGRLLVGSSFESLRRRLEAANAFQDDDSAILRF